MQSVKLKNGLEIVSVLIDKRQAQADIVQKFIRVAQVDRPEVLRELNVNTPGVPGAIILLRYVNELVDLEQCSDEFKLLVNTQRDLIMKCIGEMSTSDDDETIVT